MKLKKKKEMSKKEKKIFSKQFVTTEPTKYGLRKNIFNRCLSLKLNKKKGIFKKEKKILSKQFVRIKRNLNEIWLKVKCLRLS